MHPLQRVGGTLGGVVDKFAVDRAVGRVRDQITRARTVGKFAVDRAVGRIVDEVRRQLDVDDQVETDDDQSGRARPAEAEDHHDVAPAASVQNAGDLALPDYDHLPAAHVVAALGDLEPDERDAIERYERAGRHRRTILGKLDQLRAEP